MTYTFFAIVFCGIRTGMNSIIKSFSEHGTFVQPDTLNYILSKDNPQEFASLITKNLTEFPLVLTIEHIKEIEQSKLKAEEAPKPVLDSQEIKKLQTRMLSEIYRGEVESNNSEEIELEYDDPDKDDQIGLSDEEPEAPVPQVLDIKKLKG